MRFEGSFFMYLKASDELYDPIRSERNRAANQPYARGDQIDPLNRRDPSHGVDLENVKIFAVKFAL